MARRSISARLGSGPVKTRPAPEVRAAAGADPVDMGALPTLLGYVLRRAQLAVFQDFLKSCALFDIRPTQFSVLTIVERNPGLKQSQVGDALGVKRANFVALLDGLERRGLVRREQSATDRRSYALYLTRDGEDLLARLNPVIADHEARLAEALGPGGREALLDLLARLSGFDEADAAGEDDGD
ncbi:MarR family winged helix-turn-helix transcriptional regulator [Segnochrobactraceae bacterium EtOH-i3]